MKDFQKDMVRLQTLIGEAFNATVALVALSDGGTMNPKKLQQTLERTAAEFEKSVLEVRTICETYSPGVGEYGKKPTLPLTPTTGFAERFGYNWLHIQLNTLLPHCRYQTPAWLSDTIRRLLDKFERDGGQVPYYREPALLVIDEHSDIDGRSVFDQDNKGWKSICNALKGRAVPDDDQYSLGVCLLSSRSPENICHITLMDARDAGDFFALHSSDYAVRDIYEGF